MADSNSICSVDGCNKTVRSNGMCHGHNHKARRHGDPRINLRVPRGLAEDFFENTVLKHQGKDCLMWPYGKSSRGYGRMTLEGKRGFVHRFACERVHGEPPTDKHQAAHECGNGHLGCVNPRHLSWKTRLENKADELVHGTRNRGGRNGRSKLTEEDAMKIVDMKRSGLRSAQIASRFSISKGTVDDINSGRSWACLQR